MISNDANGRAGQTPKTETSETDTLYEMINEYKAEQELEEGRILERKN